MDRSTIGRMGTFAPVLVERLERDRIAYAFARRIDLKFKAFKNAFGNHLDDEHDEAPDGKHIDCILLFPDGVRSFFRYLFWRRSERSRR